jgi:hypothetical protein
MHCIRLTQTLVLRHHCSCSPEWTQSSTLWRSPSTILRHLEGCGGGWCRRLQLVAMSESPPGQRGGGAPLLIDVCLRRFQNHTQKKSKNQKIAVKVTKNVPFVFAPLVAATACIGNAVIVCQNSSTWSKLENLDRFLISNGASQPCADAMRIGHRGNAGAGCVVRTHCATACSTVRFPLATHCHWPCMATHFTTALALHAAINVQASGADTLRCA